jgi:hypothetical protein
MRHRWGYLAVLLFTFIAQGCVGGSVPARAPIPLVGTWELVADQGIGARGEVLASDSNVVGLIVYTAESRVAVQMMYRNGRPTVSTANDVVSTGVGLGQIKWSVQDARSAIDTYDAYFGTYEVDSARSVVTHLVRGELRPPGVGARYERHFELHGDELWLTPVDSTQHWRVIWRRVR